MVKREKMVLSDRPEDGQLPPETQTGVPVCQEAASPREAQRQSSLVEVRSLSKTYLGGRDPRGWPIEIQALQDVTFNIAEGELIAVTGLNGSGKSTLVHCLGSFEDERSCKGEIHCRRNGQMVSIWQDRLWYRQNFVGIVFQSIHLLPNLRVWQNVEIPLKLFQCEHFEHRGARREEEAREILKRLGLGDFTERRISQLSGGERQRVAIARALIKGPKLLLADEPTGNLDERRKDELMSELKRVAQMGVSVLVVTHDVQRAERFVHRIIELRDGMIVRDHQLDNDNVRQVPLKTPGGDISIGETMRSPDNGIDPEDRTSDAPKNISDEEPVTVLTDLSDDACKEGSPCEDGGRGALDTSSVGEDRPDLVPPGGSEAASEPISSAAKECDDASPEAEGTEHVQEKRTERVLADGDRVSSGAGEVTPSKMQEKHKSEGLEVPSAARVWSDHNGPEDEGDTVWETLRGHLRRLVKPSAMPCAASRVPNPSAAMSQHGEPRTPGTPEGLKSESVAIEHPHWDDGRSKSASSSVDEAKGRPDASGLAKALPLPARMSMAGFLVANRRRRRLPLAGENVGMLRRSQSGTELVRYALRDAIESKISLVSNISAIFVGTALTALLLSMLCGASELWKRIIPNIPDIDTVNVWVDPATGENPMTEEDFKTLERWPGAAGAVPNILQLVPVFQAENQDVIVALTTGSGNDPAITKLELLAGETDLDPVGWDIVICRRTAEEINRLNPMGLVGNRITMQLRRYDSAPTPEGAALKSALDFPVLIKGIVEMTSADRVYGSLNMVRFVRDYATGRSDYTPEPGGRIDVTRVTERTMYECVRVHFAGPLEAETALEDMSSGLGGRFQLQWAGSELRWIRDLQLICVIALIAIGVLVVSAGSVSLFNTLAASVARKTKEIGILMSLGVSSVDVFLIYILQAAFIGILAGVSGIVGAIGSGAILNRIIAGRWPELIEKMKESGGFFILPLGVQVSICFVVVVICVLAAFLPSLQAGRKSPMDALRSE